MPLNTWKVFNSIKNTVSKVSADKLLQANIQQIKIKLPITLGINEYLKLGGEKLNSVQQSLQNIYNSSLSYTLKDNTNHKSWKKSKSQSSDIPGQILQLLNLINLSSTESSLTETVELLLIQLRQNSEIRHIAIKLGAIHLLLRKRSKFQTDKTIGALREALTILGYIDPVSKRGIRILSIDGGGIRGVLVLEMLKKLEELTGQRTYDLFDFICGVSTGAILAYSIGIHLRKLDDIITRYEALSQEIFRQSPFWGTGNLVRKHAYYDTELWEKKLKDYLGADSLISTSRKLQTPKLCVVSAIVNQSQVQAHVFRNYSLPWKFQSYYLGTHDQAVWEAARASAAAPTYFEEFKIGNYIHQVAVHVMLSDLLPENVYYRFNPYLSEMVGMVESDQKKHEQLKRDAVMYLRRNEDKFQEAAKTLMLKKKITQEIKDKINLQRQIIGI
ncbi:calcium-independent phospholipase A2-gamma-like isoform X2 [Sitophilus oryzae]|uniref:Calcium-independent phospholipase A2-gamma-like isoform X2 n=1 Tax=Sitophilus oryzae TaxID=7048 RepID=A0A6J2XSV3_SITOR|nr:calcium-independent phospholipase A2-gamma-like isoform X2 [Sitophilus oryzae]